MSGIAEAAEVIRAEAAAAQRASDTEFLAGAAMCYVQARVRPWREAARIGNGEKFTPWDEILHDESGYCGSCVIVWRLILHALGIPTRQLEFYWLSEYEPYEVGHVCGEAWWGKRWHFFDVMTATLWKGRGVFSWEQVRLNPRERKYRVSNTAALRYTAYERWFAADPFAYVTVEPLRVEMLESFL